MPTLRSIGVVSFNANEANAVDRLLSDLASGAPSPWQRDGTDAIRRRFGPEEDWRLEHVPLLAQGNVLAAARLAEFFQDRSKAPDYVVFYGCAGAIDPANDASVFLVEDVNYLSLGTVEAAPAGELVTLKNKWLCHLDPAADVQPLDVVTFPACTPGGSFDLPALSGIPLARVAATDKVVRVGRSGIPEPVRKGPPHDRWKKAEWTYGQALDLVARGSGVVLVEMESYGIGRIAQALKIADRVVVLRVTTDALTDHGHTSARQLQLLEDGRRVLARVLAVLFTRSFFGS